MPPQMTFCLDGKNISLWQLLRCERKAESTLVNEKEDAANKLLHGYFWTPPHISVEELSKIGHITKNNDGRGGVGGACVPAQC